MRKESKYHNFKIGDIVNLTDLCNVYTTHGEMKGIDSFSYGYSTTGLVKIVGFTSFSNADCITLVNDGVHTFAVKSSSPYLERENIPVLKDYDILSFYNTNSKGFFIKKEDGLFYFEGWDSDVLGLYESDIKSLSVNKIHSVRRISDNKVLTVGDEVNIPAYPFPCTITSLIDTANEISVQLISEERRIYSLNDLI